IATASGDACACAAVLSVALTASTYASYGANFSQTPAVSTVRSSAVTTKRPAASASSSLDMPALRRLLVAAGVEVDPGGGSLEAVVDGRADVVDLVCPREAARAFYRLDPDAAHFRLHLAVPLG